MAGIGIRVLESALSVNEIKGLPGIPEDVCSVRERLQKMKQDNGEALRYSLRVTVSEFVARVSGHTRWAWATCCEAPTVI